MLLQILDDGRLTDSQGRVVNFENTVIILTTNAYGKNGKATLGFGGEDDSLDATEADAIAALKKVFRPEFLNRVDEIVVFETLKRESLLKITRLMLKEVESECTSRGIKLSVTDAAVELMTDNGYDAEYGARPLRRYIQRNIEDELAEKQLMGLLEGCKVIVVDAKDGKLDITIEK
jgi:ATP-dependent Clp protease ATP-binding subunit ClpE